MAPTGAHAGRQGIRYVNVGTIFNGSSPTNIDLIVTNRSQYTPDDPRSNVLLGEFAQINLACNSQVDLRVSTVLSCSTGVSCRVCDGRGTEALVRECYEAGCSCYGTTVRGVGECSGTASADAQAAYSCTEMDTPVRLPSETMVSMTVYDFDTGPVGGYEEQLRVPNYAYFRTPLRAASGNEGVVSTIHVDTSSRTFSATALGDSSDNPTSPTRLTDAQASKGVQFFFRSERGYVDATFIVSSYDPQCMGRN